MHENPSGETRAGQVVTDSAGVTCRYTPITEVCPDDVVYSGWRFVVEGVENHGGLWRLHFKDGSDSRWLPAHNLVAVEVPS